MHDINHTDHERTCILCYNKACNICLTFRHSDKKLGARHDITNNIQIKYSNIL